MFARHWKLWVLVALVGCEAKDAGEDDSKPPASDEALGEELGGSIHESGILERLDEQARREFVGGPNQRLEQFASECDLATGIHVPDFKCSEGTLVPTTNHVNGSCDRPNRLNRECDPGSRFQVVSQNANAVAVAHCRKKNAPGNVYLDIAVIQYNKVNGATCYYQAGLEGVDGDFKAPTLGTRLSGESAAPNPNAAPWYRPERTKGINCAGCHDNGAIIRSPYLSQLSILPGAGDASYNRDQPVSFIGDDFQSWQLFRVQIPGNTCNGCHRMGVSNTASFAMGTARDFGLRATATSETAKNPHSAASPIWMLPGQITFNASVQAQAQQIANCGNAFGSGSALPAGCTVTRFSTAFTGMTPALASRVLATALL